MVAESTVEGGGRRCRGVVCAGTPLRKLRSGRFGSVDGSVDWLRVWTDLLRVCGSQQGDGVRGGAGWMEDTACGVCLS